MKSPTSSPDILYVFVASTSLSVDVTIVTAVRFSEILISAVSPPSLEILKKLSRTTKKLLN